MKRERQHSRAREEPRTYANTRSVYSEESASLANGAEAGVGTRGQNNHGYMKQGPANIVSSGPESEKVSLSCVPSHTTQPCYESETAEDDA